MIEKLAQNGKKIDPFLVKKEIDQKGYYSLESFFNEKFIQQIERDSTSSKLNEILTG